MYNAEYRKNRNIKFHLFYLVLIPALFSCGTVRSIPETRHRHVIEKVPFYPQESYQCGPASLASVLNYWGINVTPDDISKSIFSETARGTLNIDMVLYAQSKGLNAKQYKGSMEDIRKNIDYGYPVIVLVDYGFSLYHVNHFMVIVGYSESGVIANSGKDEGKFIYEEDFITVWDKTNFWMLLIKNKH
ncbi:MAG: hypothetical protein A2Y97_11115 [Nitrospirae bacterium RBG_13_39_12]|nr:MAG: hypothetical protein A2Y97_11115 [Nitrospirae bacterium RBG_13_39_12]